MGGKRGRCHGASQGAVSVNQLNRGEKRRWMLSAALAAVVVAGVVLLFRVPGNHIRPAPAKGAVPVQVARPGRADPLLREETELRDLTPLFLPTERNASLAPPRREPGRTFLDDESPKYRFTEAELHLAKGLPPASMVNGKPAAAAEPVDTFSPQVSGSSLAGFGRRPWTMAAFSSRGGFVEVVAAGSGRPVLSDALPPRGRPPGDKAWGPVEFLAVVDAAGLASPLIVTEGSRVEEVDAFLGNYLTRTYRVGDRLAPGFYRITVAP